MTYQERKTIVSAIAIILVSLIYYFIVKESFLKPGLSQVEIFKQWALFIIIFIPIQIVVKIVVIIISNIITNVSESIKNGCNPLENDYETEDELDKQVDLKSSLIGTYVFALFIFGGLTTLIFMLPITIMFNVFFFGIVATGVVSEIAKIYYYRKGF